MAAFPMPPPRQLHPEVANTFEASLERQVTRGMALVVNGFHYRIGQVIEAVTLDDGVLQYRNAGRLVSTGLELELKGKLGGRIEASASTAIQNATGGEPVDWRLAISGVDPSRSHRLSGDGAKGLRSQRRFPLVRVHGGQGGEVVNTRRRVVLHSTSEDLVAEQIQQVQDRRANGLPSP